MRNSTKLRSAMAVGVAVAAALVLAACGAGDPQADPTPSATATTTAGGIVTVAGPYATDSLDPHGTASAALGTSLSSQSIFSRLVKPTDDGEIVSDLAEEWESNDDATEWTFTLRDDVVFSDDTPLSSADVIASLERAVALAGPVAGNFKDIVVSAPDATTVVFTSPAPEPALPGKLTLFFVVKAGSTDASFAEQPVGSGPFTVKAFTPGDRLELIPNESYYGDVPIVDEMVLRNIPDITARLTALQTGEVQATWGIPDDQVGTLESNTDLVVESVPSTSVTTMWFNSSRPALASAEVRNALWQAVDFDTIMTALYPNTGAQSLSTVAPTVFGFSEQEPKEYDPEAAKAALEDAGFDFSQPLVIQYSGDQYGQFIQAVASDLAKIDVQAVPTPKDSATFLKDLLALNWDINFQQLSTPTFDAATNLGRLYTCAAKRTGYCNEELDEALAAAGSTADTAVREENYAIANEIIWDDAVGMYPMSLAIPYAWQSDLKGFAPNPSYLPDLAAVSY